MQKTAKHGTMHILWLLFALWKNMKEIKIEKSWHHCAYDSNGIKWIHSGYIKKNHLQMKIEQNQKQGKVANSEMVISYSGTNKDK